MQEAQKKEQKNILPDDLDKIDWQILQLLESNARMTIKEIADKVHLSTSPVHDRIKKLEQSGIIQQYVTLLNAAKVNKGLWVICYVSLKQHNKSAGSKFIKAIQAMPEVKECYNISGEFDFMLKVAVKNMESYYDFHVNQLSEAENIGHVQSVFVMGIVKQTHTLLS
ncbi:MAG: winged helix-turn-helix transcriptional regulator [Hydrotalea flava]|uniref:Lrp/AsnC family transcriptional regulator n=1 Tax=Hydrotalea TaxID=1004300 RepID=UPI000943CB58|nr:MULTISPECIES: Lrp/AsnC family transcriptional regulator [Hydrotalea]MBY0346848.1 Lrp/AsnC family transcriptional regulator [Hydrotalea flava]NIM34597.1 winged helix-turn-helix transcriptional regulator [Hydrotalea flava]NIM37443.1 winged helix-turn-helix transcriptional regulator [Hydrotalea flava]NIN03191.1 winged helix-turn-helix transcriptional regulator [Hydrotalea flava]NIN14282.1 winged helix-turn-helix transcriptional regulator [Hydrotalea flava]